MTTIQVPAKPSGFTALPYWMYATLWFVLPVLPDDLHARASKLMRASQVYWLERRNVKRLSQMLNPEAKLFGRLLTDRLAGIGYKWATRSEYDHGKASGSGRAKPTTFKVKFERIYTKPEALFYKVLVRKRTLFGTANALPYMTLVSDLATDIVVNELSAACERKVTVKYDDPRFGFWYIVHRGEGIGLIPKHVAFNDMLDKYPKDISLIPWAMGVGKARNVVTLYLAKHPHLLIAGPTGTGKSNAVNGFILGLMYHALPSEIQFILFDLKEGIEFDIYKNSVHLQRPIVSKPDEALAALLEMSLEIDRRLGLLRDSDCKDLPAYNVKFPEQRLPILIGVIDEYAQLVLPVDKKISNEANRLIVRISALGRAAGIQIVVCTQYPTREVVSPQIKINLNLKLAFRCQNPTQSMVILNDPRASNLPAEALGRGLFALGPDIFEVQIAYVADPDTKAILKYAQERAQASLPAPEPDDPRALLQWPTHENEVMNE
jgi:DNA segregation ATPase FtsK/SpoIIIE-like protein